jgi:hypothetical protein
MTISVQALCPLSMFFILMGLNFTTGRELIPEYTALIKHRCKPTFDCIHMAKEKQFYELYKAMSLKTRSSGLMTKGDTFEANARPETSVDLSEKASIHFSVENAEKECNLWGR